MANLGLKCSDSNLNFEFELKKYHRTSVWINFSLFRFEMAAKGPNIHPLCLKVAYLRLVDWNTNEIYGFATCGLTVQKLRLCDFGLAHLRN